MANNDLKFHKTYDTFTMSEQDQERFKAAASSKYVRSNVLRMLLGFAAFFGWGAFSSHLPEGFPVWIKLVVFFGSFAFLAFHFLRVFTLVTGGKIPPASLEKYRKKDLLKKEKLTKRQLDVIEAYKETHPEWDLRLPKDLSEPEKNRLSSLVTGKRLLYIVLQVVFSLALGIGGVLLSIYTGNSVFIDFMIIGIFSFVASIIEFILVFLVFRPAEKAIFKEEIRQIKKHGNTWFEQYSEKENAKPEAKREAKPLIIKTRKAKKKGGRKGR